MPKTQEISAVELDIIHGDSTQHDTIFTEWGDSDVPYCTVGTCIHYSRLTLANSEYSISHGFRKIQIKNDVCRILDPPTPNTHSTKRTRTQHCSLRMYSSHVHTVLLIISTELIQSSPFDVSEIWEVTSYNVNFSCPVVKRDTDAPIQDWRLTQPVMEIGASVWVRDPEQSWVSSTVVSKVRYRSHTLVSFHHSIWPLIIDVFT